MQVQPVMLHERNQTLDILRGFSLLGIILVNIFGFFTPQPHINISSWFTDRTDISWHQTLDIFVQSSFYPLFSILFGYGMAMQYIKAQERQLAFYPYAWKRLAVLLVVGLLHGLLIWWGDILATYAICGVLLVVCMRLNRWLLLTIAIILNGLFHLFFVLLLLAGGIAQEPIDDMPVDIELVQQSITAYGAGDWSDALVQRFADWQLQMSVGMIIISQFIILPYMLLGAALSKFKLIEHAKQFKVFWVLVAVLFTTIGLFIKYLPYIYEQTQFFDYVKIYIGGPIVAIGYIGCIVVLCYIPFIQKLAKPIANIGRLSMTMYILQSIALSLIIYNFGLGLYGDLDVPTAVLIAVTIYIIEVIVATIWLAKFKQGPLEALTKRIVYGRKNLSEK